SAEADRRTARRPGAAGRARGARAGARAGRPHLPPPRRRAADGRRRTARPAQDPVPPSDPLHMSTTTDAGLAAGWREQALAALEDGRTAEAREWLRQAVAETTALEWLNDLAVL